MFFNNEREYEMHEADNYAQYIVDELIEWGVRDETDDCITIATSEIMLKHFKGTSFTTVHVREDEAIRLHSEIAEGIYCEYLDRVSI